MCGICGVLAVNAGTEIPHLERQIRTMLQSMAHRGPDGSAMLSRANIIMAVNRLAIRGVDEQQAPLIENDAGIIVACNGEIDNHRELRRFLAQSGYAVPQSVDVAVIAPLYLEKGLAFLEHLQGVFALALWDPSKQRLILARDRAGERHLYYSVSSSRTIYFASELAGLLTARRGTAETDWDALGHYLRSGYCPSPRSLLLNHYKVSPGEMIVIEPSGTRHLRYWNFPTHIATGTPPSPQSFDRVFRNAVFRQSDIDVDYGVLLSGGVDSALLTAVTRSVRPDKKLPAYCIRFSETSFDEGLYAARIAGDLGCDFVPVNVSWQDLPATLHDLIAATGEPLADPAWIPLTLVAKRASQDVRVLLGGEGADELFGGYPTYLGAHLANHYARLPRAVRMAFQRLVERLPPSDRNMTVSFLLKRFVRGQELDGLARHLLWTASIPPTWLRRLGVEPPEDCTQHDSDALIDAIQQYDFEQPLPEALMAKADYGGMCQGVEIRAPFLDQAVIEFAATLPLNERIRGLTTKVFLKRYARRYLPRSVVNRRKRGLSVPLASWFREPLFDWAHTRLSSSGLANVGINNEVAIQLLLEHRSRLNDNSRAVWTLVVLSEWLEWLSQMSGVLVDA
ncbi:MAG: asparagine synthase (glutamine-hydrolyzing) [Rhodanobacteraceae bacterium]